MSSIPGLQSYIIVAGTYFRDGRTSSPTSAAVLQRRKRRRSSMSRFPTRHEIGPGPMPREFSFFRETERKIEWRLDNRGTQTDDFRTIIVSSVRRIERIDEIDERRYATYALPLACQSTTARGRTRMSDRRIKRRPPDRESSSGVLLSSPPAPFPPLPLFQPGNRDATSLVCAATACGYS